MKDKTFILDFNLLNEHGLSIDDFLILIHAEESLYNDSQPVLEALQEKQFIKIINNDKIVLREKAKLFIKLITIENPNSINNTKSFKKPSNKTVDEFDEFIEKFRNKWKGLKPGSMGSSNACKDKMIRWMQENPTYSTEQILNAADVYINSLTNFQYLQQADYFIYKREGKDEMSRLSAFVDEETVNNDEWLTQLK